MTAFENWIETNKTQGFACKRCTLIILQTINQDRFIKKNQQKNSILLFKRKYGKTCHKSVRILHSVPSNHMFIHCNVNDIIFHIFQKKYFWLWVVCNGRTKRYFFTCVVGQSVGEDALAKCYAVNKNIIEYEIPLELNTFLTGMHPRICEKKAYCKSMVIFLLTAAQVLLRKWQWTV